MSDTLYELAKKASAGSKPRRIMRAFKLDAISGVDRAAQEPAVVRIMKRAEDIGDKWDDYDKAEELATHTFSVEGEEGGEKIEKKAALTSSTEGHAHILWLDQGSGELTNGHTSYVDGHSHPWVMTDGGDGYNYTIGEAQGHTHTLATLGKRTFTAQERKRLAQEGKAMSDGGFPIVTIADLRNAIAAFGRAANKAGVAKHIRRRARALGATDLLPKEGLLASLLKEAGDEDGGEEGTMPAEKQKKEDQSVEDRLVKMEAEVTRLTKYGALSDAEKAHYDGLDNDEAKAEFLGKSADDRKAILEEKAAAEGKKKVVYKSVDGEKYTAEDDERLVALARKNDVLTKRLADAETERELAVLTKRANEELGHLPGPIEARVALLKSIDAIPDEEARKAALEGVKAGDEALAKAFDRFGAGGSGAVDESSPEAQLNKLAKEHQKNAKEDMTFEQAFAKVCETEEGARLYAKMVEEAPVRSGR